MLKAAGIQKILECTRGAGMREIRAADFVHYRCTFLVHFTQILMQFDHAEVSKKALLQYVTLKVTLTYPPQI